MAEQGKEPSLHNEELEAAVKDFKADQTKEKMLKIMTCLEKATVMQPGALPKGMDPQKIQCCSVNCIACGFNGVV